MEKLTTIKFPPNALTYFINPNLEIIDLHGQEHMVWCETNTEPGLAGLKGLPLLFKITNDGWVRIHIHLNQFACYSGNPKTLRKAKDQIIILLMKHTECTQATIEYLDHWEDVNIVGAESYNELYSRLKNLR